MPELPEVETLRRGLIEHLVDQTITRVTVREPRLRWPVPPNLSTVLPQQRIQHIHRRAKYLLLACTQGHLLIHLGMSGTLRLLPAFEPSQKHDHIDIFLTGARCLRYHDPRRFGSVLWTEYPLTEHPLLKHLGPEPLEDIFDGYYLYTLAQGRRQAVKNYLMDNRVVVGIGNIYANEALFLASIHPNRAAGTLTLTNYEVLANTVKQVLHAAIEQGGTTLRDFSDSQGRPGYFKQSLQVYGRAGAPCVRCHQLIQAEKIGQRTSYFCPSCQH